MEAAGRGDRLSGRFSLIADYLAALGLVPRQIDDPFATPPRCEQAQMMTTVSILVSPRTRRWFYFLVAQARRSRCGCRQHHRVLGEAESRVTTLEVRRFCRTWP